MSKKKRSTRRSISMRGLTYQRILAHCEGTGLTCSGWLERLVHRELDRLGTPREEVLRPRQRANTGPRDPQDAASGIFTF